MNIKMIARILPIIMLLCLLMIAEQAHSAPMPVDSDSIKISSPRRAWLTMPESRVVLNPTFGFPQSFLPSELKPSLPVEVGYHFGNFPKGFQALWSLVPGDIDKSTAAATVGPSLRFSQQTISEWSKEGEIDCTSDGTSLRTVLGGPDGYTWSAVTHWVDVDLDETPYLMVTLAETNGWCVTVSDESGKGEVWLHHECRDAGDFLMNVKSITGWSGKKKVRVRLIGIGRRGNVNVWTRCLFAGFSGANSVPKTDSTDWYPHKIVSTASNSDLGCSAETTTIFSGASMLVQSIRLKNMPDGCITLAGSFPCGQISWDSERRILLLQNTSYCIALSVSRPPINTRIYSSWIDWLRHIPSADARGTVWSMQFNGLKKDDELVVASLFVHSPRLGSEEALALSRAVSTSSFADTLQTQKQRWDTWLSSVPRPIDFKIQTVDSKGATPEAVRKAYYRAWAFIISDTICPMPENNYPYPQLSVGKSSMWAEGHPRSYATAQWECFFGTQFLAFFNPKLCWSIYQGMMSLVDANGNMEGEGLPSRHGQAAWTLYSFTQESRKLAEVYPAAKRFLISKARDPRWLYYNTEGPNRKDSNFAINALADMVYMRRIAEALGWTDEVDYWNKSIADYCRQCESWFWDKPGGTGYCVYNEKERKRENPDGWGLLMALALPEISTQTMHDSLICISAKHASYLKSWCQGYPYYNYIMRGLWREGQTDMPAAMAEVSMRDITQAGEFSESYSQAIPPQPTGVMPEVSGACLIIDGVLWHNGVIMGDGLPIIAHLPNANGVENLHFPFGVLNVRFAKESDVVELWGDALKALSFPEGFERATRQDGTLCWRGKILKGKSIKLVAF